MNASLRHIDKMAAELVGKDKNPVENSGGAIPAGHASFNKDAGWRKSAQSALDSVKFDPQAMMTNTKDRLHEFWAKLSPATKQTLLNSAIGGLVGGGVGGAAGMAYSEPGHGLSEMVSKGLLGGAMGGAAAGLGTAGYQAATSGRVLPGEERGLAPADRLANTVVGGMAHNPMLTAGTGLGAYGGYQGYKKLVDASKDQVVSDRLLAELNQLAQGNPTILRKLMDLTGATARMIGSDHRIGGGAIGIAALPVGMGMGWLADRYLKGKND